MTTLVAAFLVLALFIGVFTLFIWAVEIVGLVCWLILNSIFYAIKRETFSTWLKRYVKTLSN